MMLIAGVSLSGDTVDRGVFMIHKETKITVDSGIIFFHVVSRTKTGAQWQMRWGTPGWGNHRLSKCHSGSYGNVYRSINVAAQKLYINMLRLIHLDSQKKRRADWKLTWNHALQFEKRPRQDC